MIFSCSEGERGTLDVPLQRTFTGPRSVLSDDTASISCKELDPSGLLELMNFHLGTSYTLKPSRKSLLKRALHHSCDFGVAYALLRSRWSMDPGHAKKNIDKCRSVHDTARQNASDSGVPMNMMPRRIWDLWSNRVVPIWMVFTDPASALFEGPSYDDLVDLTSVEQLSFFAVSHPWVDADKRQVVETPINSYEWPVPLPAKTTLERIRTELLHLTSEEKTKLVWLDVLCLRQKDTREKERPLKEESQAEDEKERLRVEEWRTDIPTIGAIYAMAYSIIYYYSGLGLPFEIGNLDYKRHWLNRAWTLQEMKANCFGYIAGIPASCPSYCSSGLLGWQNFEDLSVGEFCRRMMVSSGRWGSPDLFWAIASMRSRSAESELDKI